MVSHVATVRRWTGAETHALRQAMRHSLRDFAEHLGVAIRTVSKWEARGDSIQLVPDSQELLDTALSRASEEVKTRFDQLLHERDAAGNTTPFPAMDSLSSAVFVPVIIDGQSGLIPVTTLIQPSGDTHNTNDGGVAVPAFGNPGVPASEWGPMSPLNRRHLLQTGLTAAALPALGFGTDALPAHTAGTSGLLPSSVQAGASWAVPIGDAVLNPTEAIRRATSNGDHATATGIQAEVLRRNIDQAVAAELASDYGQLAQTLPDLLGYAEAASLHAPTRDDVAVQTALSDVYTVAAWTLIKGDNALAAWVAAQRAIQVAEQTEDVLRTAASTRCLAEVYMRAKNFHDATRTAFLATVQLDTLPTDRTAATCLRGAALLSAAAAAARSGDSREANTALKAAAVCAADLGEDRDDFGTVFGPTNVAIHHVAVAVELGDARTALKHVNSVRLDEMPPELAERRARFLIDVARCHAAVGDDTAALDALMQAETIASAELRGHRLTHELVRELLTRERRSSELRALAERCYQLN